MKIHSYLISKGAIICEDYRAKVDEWRCWYRGKVRDFHEYRIFNGQKRITHRRLTLGMPKKAAEDWANLLLNERVVISTDSDRFNKTLGATLAANKFWSRGNQLIEKTFALGTGALVEWKDANGGVVIDYVEADMIFPITIENGEIIECAFASEVVVGGKRCSYVQTHLKGRIENALLDSDGKQIPLPDGVAAEVPTKVRQFQILKPNIVNNFDSAQPMGLSVFANALDAAKGCDVVYDSLINEFVIGRSRIMVPMKFAQIQMAADGLKRPAFDPNDTVFYVFESQDDKAKIETTQPEIRADQHVTALNRTLALFSDKCGLGNDRYRYDGKGVQTATAVISEKSELYQNVQKHELMLRDALLDLVAAIASMLGATYKEATVVFDDSIIEDKAARKAQFIAEINSGIRQAWEYRVEFLGEDEATARTRTGEIEATGAQDGGGREAGE